jgi:hypothetical protein
MDDNSKEIRGRGGRRGTRGRIGGAGSVAAGLAGLILIVAGCTSGSASPGVANVSATSSTTGSSSSSPSAGSGKASPLAFSQCMRSHGVADFPDPNSQGQISISGGPGSDLDPNNPTFQAAQTACQNLQPKPSPAQQHQNQQDALKYAQCMRAHGIADFPDPTSSGGLRISAGAGSDLDPNNPTFKAAQSACQHDLPGANGGGLRIHAGSGPPPGSSGNGTSSGKAFG